MSSPQVAVLVAAYNAHASLPQCLDSLCAQTLADIEVLCVDDSSTDDTYALLRSYAQRDPRFKVLRTPVNSGQAMARNMALNFVHAPFVCMVDADDWLSPDCLQLAVDVFRQHPTTDCVAFRLMLTDGQGNERDYGLPTALAQGRAMNGNEAFEACMDGWQLHGLYLTRTELHKQYPFDTATRLYSDDNTSRLHYLHSREVRACQGIYYYRQHSQSMTNSFNLHRFDFMEANLSLLAALRKEPHVSAEVMQRFEGSRWMTFLSCYRLFLKHETELTTGQKAELRHRFVKVLNTFSRHTLKLKYRWRPGYWLLSWPKLFEAQQRFYRFVRLHIGKND